MAATLGNNVFDNGLSYIDTNASHLYICSTQPTTYAEATTALGSGGYALGNKNGLTISAPADGDVSGRKITISQITDGNVTTDGTAAWWAVVYATGTELLATQAISPSQGVTTGNTFQIGPIDIELPDPTA